MQHLAIQNQYDIHSINRRMTKISMHIKPNLQLASKLGRIATSQWSCRYKKQERTKLANEARSQQEKERGSCLRRGNCVKATKKKMEDDE